MDVLPSFFANTIALISVSCFVKVLTTLSIFRYGLGLRGLGFGLVILLFSLGISWMAMEPHLQKVGGLAVFTQKNVVSAQVFESEFRPFLKKNIDEDILARLQSVAPTQPAASKAGRERVDEEIAFPVLLTSFLISELRDAFLLGFLFIVPFFVIDLLVANALMVLGMTNIETFAVSFPLKILLFFAVDGWSVITGRLLQTYGG